MDGVRIHFHDLQRFRFACRIHQDKPAGAWHLWALADGNTLVVKGFQKRPMRFKVFVDLVEGLQINGMDSEHVEKFEANILELSLRSLIISKFVI